MRRLAFFGLAFLTGALATAQTIQPGCDCYETEAPTSVEVPLLPADFFGPGSDPFAPTVVLMEGEPLPLPVIQALCPNAIEFETVWVDRHGTPVQPDDIHKVGTVQVQTVPDIDTIVCRPGAVPLPGMGGSAPVPIEMVELSLRSIAPITVTYNGGLNPEQWNVFVTENGPSPPGQMTITTTGQVPGAIQGGMVLDGMPVQYQLNFERVGGGQVAGPINGNLNFTEGSNPGQPPFGNWTFFLGSGPGIPTMGEWALIALALGLVVAGIFVLRRLRPAVR